MGSAQPTDDTIIARPPVAACSVWEWLIWFMAWCMVPFEMWYAYVICFLHTWEQLLLTHLTAEFRCCPPVLLSEIVLHLGEEKCTGRNGPSKSLWKRKSEVLKQGGLEARACVSAMLCFSNSWISWSLPFYFSPPEELNRRLELK